MKTNYRTILLFLTCPMAFGYNPVTDTLSRVFDLDYLTGRSDYYTGCESLTKTMSFQEIHAGYKSNIYGRTTFHIDGGLVPTDVEPVDSYGGGRDLFGYVVAGYDINWEYLGLGLSLGNVAPVLDPYVRLGSRKILYVDAGCSHRFPVASSGAISLGVGSGFGSDRVNLWIGRGSNLQIGELDNTYYNGTSIDFDCRIVDRVAIKFGGLSGDNSSKSAWFGLRYYFK